MAYAPPRVYGLDGCFQHKETGAVFEYADIENDALSGVVYGKALYEWDKAQGATHVVFVGPWCPGINDRMSRAAIVKKTVAYVATDEDEYGRAVWEKWPIVKHCQYKRGE